ncbi:MAG: DUF512 domain-containing protein [Blautia sp.]|nr:DUF512 domain-containing protein [Blautia sp.]
MRKQKKHVILRVLPGSIAEELELVPGDSILAVNGKEIEDVFDYRYLMNEEEVLILVEKQDGEIWELEVEKEYEEDLGVEFENGLMDEYRSCKNKCIFCFIDQMPPGMRRTLYFKDDDSRLSFLQGNYVTLTNMSDHDIERIIEYRLEPINISFQAMESDLRCRMLHNRFAGEALKKADRLFEAGITMNGQIVLCKGVNDGEHLEYSLRKLSSYVPVLQSVSVVPVGLTKFREGLYPLEPFTKEDAREVLQRIHSWQERMFEKTGLHFVHASDEWYLLAEEPLPEEDSYDGYLQLENGVGMLRLLREETRESLSGREGDDRSRDILIATGLLAAPEISGCIAMIQEKYPNIRAEVIPIVNHFFGDQITVSGLITGQDLIRQLSGCRGKEILIPCNMLRDGEEVFLDDITVQQACESLSSRIVVADRSGEDLVRCVLGEPRKERKRRQTYEQTSGSHRGQAECGEIDLV